jgi:hypothetical protein
VNASGAVNRSRLPEKAGPVKLDLEFGAQPHLFFPDRREPPQEFRSPSGHFSRGRSPGSQTRTHNLWILPREISFSLIVFQLFWDYFSQQFRSRIAT